MWGCGAVGLWPVVSQLENLDEEDRIADLQRLIPRSSANLNQPVTLINPPPQRREVIAAKNIRAEFMHRAVDDERVARAGRLQSRDLGALALLIQKAGVEDLQPQRHSAVAEEGQFAAFRQDGDGVSRRRALGDEVERVAVRLSYLASDEKIAAGSLQLEVEIAAIAHGVDHSRGQQQRDQQSRPNQTGALRRQLIPRQPARGAGRHAQEDITEQYQRGWQEESAESPPTRHAQSHARQDRQAVNGNDEERALPLPAPDRDHSQQQKRQSAQRAAVPLIARNHSDRQRDEQRAAKRDPNPLGLTGPPHGAAAMGAQQRNRAQRRRANRRRADHLSE